MARPKLLAILILIIWLGFALRLHELGTVPLRGDEAFSALNWADRSLQQSFAEIATIEPHPPLTYIVFRLWRLLIGGIDSPFSLRLLPVLGNIIGIPAAYALACRLSGSRNHGIVAALIWAIHPYEIWHSQDFRNYAIWAGLSVTSLWLGLRLIDHRRTADWLFYALFAICSVLMFYTEAFLSIAVAIVVIYWKKGERRFLFRFLALQGLVMLAAVVAFLVLQYSLVTSGAYPGNLESTYVPDYLTRFVPVLLLGETHPELFSMLWVALSLVLGLFAFLVARDSRREIQFTGAIVLVPLLLLGVASLRVNIFHPRYVLAAVPAFILLISIGSGRLAARLARIAGTRQGFMLPVLLAPWLIFSTLSLHTYFNDASFRKSPAWDELGDFLNSRVTADDLVIQLSADVAFGYYYRGPAQELALPSGPWQSAENITDELEAVRANYDSIYVVSNAIASWQNAHVVENWMRDNMQLVLRSDASGLAIRQYKEWNISDVGEAPLASFAGAVDLVSYRFFEDPLPTGEFLLWIVWRPIAITEQSLKSFVHVYGDANTETGSILWAQDDQFPQSGRIDSASWAPTEIYRDVYYLSADSLQDGTYELSVGWYDPVSGNRLSAGNGKDSFALQSFGYPPKP